MKFESVHFHDHYSSGDDGHDNSQKLFGVGRHDHNTGGDASHDRVQELLEIYNLNLHNFS